MRQTVSQIVVFFVLLTIGVSISATPLADFEATYKAKFRGFGITAIRKLETQPDGTQTLSFVADSLLASMSETSRFRWNNEQHIVPLNYTYKRGGLGRNRTAHLEFLWDQHKVINNVQDKPWKMTIPDNVLDKLNYQLQIRADMLSKGTPGDYEIADGGRLKEYKFEILGDELVDTPAGKFNATKVKRVRENEERHTIFWLAKDWDYLVVRLQQRDDDKSYEIDLHSAMLDGKPVTGL
ncbi:DUF3108 domain-containing protein [Aurantivibrio plasticivorans]